MFYGYVLESIASPAARYLGQLLTWAAGLQALTIVWIAPEFTDEHRAAMQ
jgi:hypothetical protein